jgi:hypothetical protein
LLEDQTGGDKPSSKKTGTEGTTDGQTGGDQPSNNTTGTGGTTDGQTGGDKSIRILGSTSTTNESCD